MSLFSNYYSFKGIRYAEPPIGDLRFKAPIPVKGWEGIQNATEHGEICVQPGTIFGTNGAEDCLFLNVYSPNLTPKESYPVMVWIHGGSFSSGSGNTLLYGPEPIVGENVIVVTINYRLGFLGFFSTGDKHAPGNYGLKDAIEALRWVKKNIETFGGDPERVTIFGESAGSVLVHYLLLSPLAKGLFERAISQSGTALSPWAFQDNPQARAFEVAEKMGLSIGNTEEIVNQLKSIDDVSLFAKNTPGWLSLDVPRGMTSFFFAPSIDPEDSVEPRFLPEHPVTIMKKATFNQVPYIVGSNSVESLFGVRETLIDPFLFSKFNKNPHYLIPEEWNIDPKSPEATEIIQKIKNVYFKGGPIEDKEDYVNFCSDRHFHYGVYKTAELIAEKQSAPVYTYVFSYSGSMNYVKKLLLLGDYDGAMHGDDVPYLFKLLNAPAPILPGNHAITIRSRLTSMWSNFAKTTNPTPQLNSLILTRWSRVSNEHEYLGIDTESNASTHPFGDRMLLWKELDAKYSKH